MINRFLPTKKNNSAVPTYYSPLIIIWGLRGTWYEILHDVKVIQIYFNNTVMPTYLCQWFNMCKNDPETVLHCMNLKKNSHFWNFKREVTIVSQWHQSTEKLKSWLYPISDLVTHMGILVPHLGELAYMYLSKKCSSSVVTKPFQIPLPDFMPSKETFHTKFWEK